MERPSEFLQSDLLRLMTAALDSVVAACITPKADADELRFAAARHILAAVGAGERDGGRLKHAALTHLRSRFITTSTVVEVDRFPCAHRSSA